MPTSPCEKTSGTNASHLRESLAPASVRVRTRVIMGAKPRLPSSAEFTPGFRIAWAYACQTGAVALLTGMARKAGRRRPGPRAGGGAREPTGTAQPELTPAQSKADAQASAT